MKDSGKSSLLYSQVLETGDMACHAGPRGKTPGWSGGRRQGPGKTEARVFVGFPQKGKIERGKQHQELPRWRIAKEFTC